MCKTIKIAKRHGGFTLVELLVVIAIILAIAALAAAFAPRISDDTNLSRSVDNLEQWLLTAKMRAKRDGLATGIRFIPDPNPNYANMYFQLQYIQQPDSLTGGWINSSGSLVGGQLLSAGQVPAGSGVVTATFQGVDFTLGGLPASQWLVLPGDYLEIRDGGVYAIASATSATTLQLGSSAYDLALNLTSATTNYRIIRQPRSLIGEETLVLPNNFAVDLTATSGSNVVAGSSGYPEILFSPTGAVVGTNAANTITGFLVYDVTMNPYDSNRAGLVAVQTRTGFIGAYNVGPTGNTFSYVQAGRESGL
jgi:prepilin-type N-terminal cleavage/methylation domain-containing protein